MPGGFGGRDTAYSLGDPAAHRRHYDDWAPSYDDDFAGSVGYVYPANLAECFLEFAEPGDQPAADLGCGTGLIGERLSGRGFEIDGFDISPGMLEVAAEKGVYRQLLTADLTSPRGLKTGGYGSLLSCGTFTLGHLGPDELDNALTMARPGALCVIGINLRHFREAGFKEFFDCRSAEQTLDVRQFRDVGIYSDEDPSKEVNLARMAVFRTLGQN